MSSVTATHAVAYDFEVDGVCYDVTSFDDLTCKVVKNTKTGYKGDIVIPDAVSYGGREFAVTRIEDRAFNSCYYINSISLGNSLVSIGESAFGYCYWLKSLVIPNSVTSIGDYAFSNCSQLFSVTIPNSVTSIGDYAFDGCRGLKNVTIEDGTSTLNMGYSSYSSYGETKRVGLFYDCPFESVYVGRDISCETVDGVAYSPFRYHIHLKTVVIGNTVTTIGDSEFFGAPSLTSVTIGSSVTSIGEQAFSKCEKLESVNIPGSVARIGNEAFRRCSALTTVSIPNSVTAIGDYSFSGCSGLTSLTIGSSVTSIGRQAFSGCPGLLTVTSLSATPPSASESVFSTATYLNAKLCVPTGASAYYGSATCWKNFMMTEVDVPAAVKDIVVGHRQAPVIFDLHGRKLAQPGRGFNIIGGKKVLVK